jgi:hypothetical protein
VHIDKSAALATQLLKGIFAPDKQGTPEERLAAELEEAKARRSKQAGAGVFLAFEGEADIPAPAFKDRRDHAEFGVCLDDIDKSAIADASRRGAACARLGRGPFGSSPKWKRPVAHDRQHRAQAAQRRLDDVLVRVA